VLALAQGSGKLSYRDIAAAVRRQCGGELARMATRITPRADFSNLVAPAEVRNQLREICARVATRDTVAHEWAEDSVHARSTGVTALFVGPSGTGKTLSAEALANELGLDLYRIDLAGIVSKYIGETEKNLDRVFAAAAHANAVLFFDEADALFGKRSEVKDAHDRYANIEVAYLLQKMEQFDGLAILATNLKQNLDEAFARRLTFTVTFPFPEEAERRQLWETLWPPRAPRADDVDLNWFAHEYRLSGGNIRNAVLAAAHLAAADGRIVTRAHLLHATRREYQKPGKNLVPAVAAGAGPATAGAAAHGGLNGHAVARS
jgi:SpoVK/Ycf46/Vps4 family AAA+-type ATPase